MICGCPHCLADIPASTIGGLCSFCRTNCERQLYTIMQNHMSPALLPKHSAGKWEYLVIAGAVPGSGAMGGDVAQNYLNGVADQRWEITQIIQSGPDVHCKDEEFGKKGIAMRPFFFVFKRPQEKEANG